MSLIADLKATVWKELVIMPAEYKALLKAYLLEGMVNS